MPNGSGCPIAARFAPKCSIRVRSQTRPDRARLESTAQSSDIGTGTLPRNWQLMPQLSTGSGSQPMSSQNWKNSKKPKP